MVRFLPTAHRSSRWGTTLLPFLPCLSDMGRRIAARRNQLGLTQAEAAERAGLTQQFFACVETGTKNIRAESIIGVSKALNVSTDYLLTGEVTETLSHLASISSLHGYLQIE